MTILSSILAFIIALGVLITFHEFGHYLVARWNGVKVLRFSIGFGKPIFCKRWGKDQTEWVIAAIPLGGYVKMLDEREGKVEPEDLPRSFNQQSVARRIAIVAAGPIANFLLAIVLYWVIFILGVDGLKPIIGPVTPATPAAVALFETEETIQKIEGETVASWQDVRWLLLTHAIDRKQQVSVETINQRGDIALRNLDLSHLSGDDLDGDFLAKIGLNLYRPVILPVIAQVIPESAGFRAGLMEGDEILAVNNVDIFGWMELVTVIQENPEQSLMLAVLRNNEVIDIAVIPEAITAQGKQIGKVGIAPLIDPVLLDNLMVTVSYPATVATVKAIERTWETTILTFKMIAKMVTGDVSWKNISGPISIADYAGQSAQVGVAAYIGFLALISISLGVLNLLPIPILDGGHLMFYTIEIIKGSPVSEKVMFIGQQIGMAMLLTLMVFAIFNDISRLFPS